MNTTSDGGGRFLGEQHEFVIVSRSEPDKALDQFEALDWAPAIMYYVGKMRNGVYPEGATLRQARPQELENRPPSADEPIAIWDRLPTHGLLQITHSEPPEV